MRVPMQTSFPALAAAVTVASMLVAAPAQAAGPWISDAGSADMAVAGAGRAALSLDAGSLAANPAAIGGMPGAGVTLAAIALELDYTFRGPDGAAAENNDGITMLPAAFATHRSGDLTYGLGAYSYFGLTFDSGSAWGGERAVEQAGLVTFNLGPAVAWTVNDSLTVGGSIAAQWARPELRLAVANDAVYFGPPTGLPDGRLRASGESWAASGQLGVLYTLLEGTRVGLSWTAPVEHSVALDVRYQAIHPVLEGLLPAYGDPRLELTLPQQLLLGASHETAAGTLLLVGLSWQDWSTLGEARLRLPGDSAPVFPGRLQDTWGASVGVRRALGAGWTGSAGVGYESSPATSRGVPAYFPVAAQWKLAAGIDRSLSESLRLRGVLSLTAQDDAEVVQAAHPLPLPGIPEFTGKYRDTRVYMLALATDFRL